MAARAGGGYIFPRANATGTVRPARFFLDAFFSEGGLNTPPDRADQMKRDEVFVGS